MHQEGHKEDMQDDFCMKAKMYQLYIYLIIALVLDLNIGYKYKQYEGKIFRPFYSQQDMHFRRKACNDNKLVRLRNPKFLIHKWILKTHKF